MSCPGRERWAAERAHIWVSLRSDACPRPAAPTPGVLQMFRVLGTLQGPNLTQVLTRRGYVTDEAKIRKHEELKNFALELYDIAKKIAEKCEERKMTRILVLKEGTQEDQPYKQRKKSVTLKTQEAHSTDPGRLRSGTVYKDLHDDTEEECDVEATQRRRIKGKMLMRETQTPLPRINDELLYPASEPEDMETYHKEKHSYKQLSRWHNGPPRNQFFGQQQNQSRFPGSYNGQQQMWTPNDMPQPQPPPQPEQNMSMRGDSYTQYQDGPGGSY
uniref:Uncharacterized protein n=1 Tax=Knipowitschia caucasica TaxID=637954 RepID=A0AAV2KNF4_KNICA